MSNLIELYSNGSTGKDKGIKVFDFSSPENNVAKWALESNKEIPVFGHVDLKYIEVNKNDLDEVIIKDLHGTEFSFSELSLLKVSPSKEPKVCPACGSDDIVSGHVEDSCDWVYRVVACQECDFEWIENFKFSYWEEVV